jgi:hypothetical protein
MAKQKGRSPIRSYSNLRRRRSSSLFMGPRGIARRGKSMERKKSRSLKAASQTLKIREVKKSANETYEYVAYLFTKPNDVRDTKKHHDLIADFCKCSLNDYKIYKTSLSKHPDMIGINCIKLASESDLMMLMLCHREHIRKIFRLVDEA